MAMWRGRRRAARRKRGVSWRSRALRSGDPRGDQGLDVERPQAIDPVGEVPLLEVRTCGMVDDLEPGPADQPLDLDDRPAGLKRLAKGGRERGVDPYELSPDVIEPGLL